MKKHAHRIQILGILGVLFGIAACGGPEKGTDANTPTDFLDSGLALDLQPVDDGPSLDSAIDEGSPVDPGTDTQVSLTGALSACADDSGLPDWVHSESDTTVATCGALKMYIHVVNDGVLRLRYEGAQTTAAPNHSYAVIGGQDPFVESRVVGTETGFRVCSEELALSVAESSCAITVQDATGKVLVEDPVGGGYFEGPGYLDDPLPWSVGVRRRIQASEHFYGFGEKNGPLDKRGELMHFWNSDVPGYQPDTDPLYQSMINFIGLRDDTAFGVFTDNTFRAHADMGHTDPEHYVIMAEGGDIDQYLIAGPAFSDVLKRYTALTGRLEMPPLWSLGYHQCRHGYFPDTAVMEIASQLRNRAIPADGIWLDIDYMDEFRVWTWSPTDFPDPQGFVADLADMGFHTTVIIDPGVKVDDDWPVYATGLQNHIYLNTPEGPPFIGEVWPGPSVYPDFSHPAARTWWAGYVPTMTDVGVDGLWLDMNEPANFDSNYSWTVPNWVEANGEGTPTTMAEVHNVYALGMAQASYEGMRDARPGKRPFLLTRAGYAGVQRYAATWTGDIPSTWAALQSTLPMMLNMGLSGNAFVGSDVGGWQGGGDMGPELLARWMQLGAVSPFYRNHTQKFAENQEPWAMGVEVEDISRQIISERYRMLPYWYALFEESSRTGAPILRPLVYEFQKDPSVRNLGDQAMLGSQLMVAPIQAPGITERSVYFPEGRWYEYRSGAIYEGPSTASVTVRLGALPIFARAGAIIPHTSHRQYTGQKPWSPLVFNVFPGPEQSQFVLYEDDGDSMDYKEGGYAQTSISVEPHKDGLNLTIGARVGDYPAPERQLIFDIQRIEIAPSSIEWQGHVLTFTDPPSEVPGAPTIAYDYGRRVVRFTIAGGHPGTLSLEYTKEIGDNLAPTLKEFRVQIPSSTPEGSTIHIALSSNDWTHQPLQWDPLVPGWAAGLIEVPRGAWFDYKYTRGDWNSVEKYEDCSEAANRYAFGGSPFIKQDTIEEWIDTCP